MQRVPGERERAGLGLEARRRFLVFCSFACSSSLSSLAAFRSEEVAVRQSRRTRLDSSMGVSCGCHVGDLCLRGKGERDWGEVLVQLSEEVTVLEDEESLGRLESWDTLGGEPESAVGSEAERVECCTEWAECAVVLDPADVAEAEAAEEGCAAL